ncbi:hypothetical protein [Kinneretia aquatilis]|uniref:hypothetical protein n=1 Tax=Kinneretia aquatilis TaxID=2070761 RepID=UPI00149536C2|nr:hypothetical protein [Paucibacter aquatile]WIV98464.1 hypothetical protein K9V56_002835 [Paucibacter aquatile]
MHRSSATAELAGRTLVAAASCLMVVGAIYFGLFSCGGYAWHKTAFWFSLLGLCAASVLVPSRVLHSMPRKAAFLVLVGVGYLVIEAAVAPFYPSTPESLGQYIQAIGRFAQVGSCS